MKKAKSYSFLVKNLGKLFTLVSIPWVLAALVAIILSFAFVKIPAYRISTDVDIEIKNDFGGRFRTYADLDRDNKPDKVVFDNSDCNLAGVGVYFQTGKILQWNFKGEFPDSHSSFFTLNQEEDGGVSLHLFVKSHDSLFLYSINEFDSVRYNKPPVFISRLGLRNGNSDLCVVQPRWVDMDNDGFNELVFGLNSGFGKWPRKMFIYSFERNELKSMKDNMHYLKSYYIVDLNNDMKLEIIPEGYASDNISDSVYRFHDRSCWMMVLDKDLNYLFEPIEFQGKYKNLHPFILKNDLGQPELFASFSQPIDGKTLTKVYHFDKDGKYALMDSLRYDYLELNFQNNNGYIERIILKGEFLYMHTNKGFDKLETTFIPTEIVMMPGYSFTFDMDNDGEQEILAYSEKIGELAVIRSDWKTYTSIPWNLTPDYCISILKTNDNPVICIHSSGKSGFITYAQNPHYIFRFLYYLAIYLFVLGFIYLVRWIQKKQLEKQNAVLKKLEELQLKLTKTRLDSHFTFNVLNSVIISIGQGRKDEAEKQLREFARMYRYLLSKAECVVVTLESELSFVDSYLLLENFRFDNRYEIVKETSTDIDLSIPIPKLIVQTLVENAIKHGLYNKEGNGKIILRAFQNNHHIQIDVEDNGIGRDAAQHLSPESSGLGFKMLHQILELYHKTSGIQIKCLVEDLKDEDQMASGTRVSLMVPLP